jgi:glucokinase
VTVGSGHPPAIPVLEIGGTHVTAALVDPTAWLLVPGSAKRRDIEAQGSAEELVGAFVSAAAELPTGEAVLGVAIPDPFDYATGVGQFRGVGKFESLYGLDLRSAILEGVPALDGVAFVNDADAFLIGEWVNGAATGYQRCVAITLGTGIGSAFLADGGIVDSGPDVAPGGRAHRLMVRDHPLEDLVSRRAMRRAYAEATGDTEADVLDIALRARDGDRVSAQVLSVAMQVLGEALGPIMHRFAPDVIVVGGSMAGSWDLFEPSFRAGLRRDRQHIVVAEHLEHAPLVGAAWSATHEREPADT